MSSKPTSNGAAVSELTADITNAGATYLDRDVYVDAGTACSSPAATTTLPACSLTRLSANSPPSASAPSHVDARTQTAENPRRAARRQLPPMTLRQFFSHLFCGWRRLGRLAAMYLADQSRATAKTRLARQPVAAIITRTAARMGNPVRERRRWRGCRLRGRPATPVR